MVRGIILGHSNFAKSIFETAEKIVGPQPFIDFISNDGLSRDSLNEKIKSVIESNKKLETLLFVDLPGGSCTMSCLKLMEDYPNLKILCGINLPILLEFFLLRKKFSAEELIPILIKKGKDNIFQLGGEGGQHKYTG
jgi:mannose/fructose-specific phosphotransferase system component IIA